MLRVTPRPLEGIQGATKTPHPRRRSKGATKTPHPLEGIQGTDPQQGPAKKNRKGPKLAISPCGKNLSDVEFFFPVLDIFPGCLDNLSHLVEKNFSTSLPDILSRVSVKLFILSCGSWCRSSRIQPLICSSELADLDEVALHWFCCMLGLG